MAFRRKQDDVSTAGSSPTPGLIGIGMNFAGAPDPRADIEETLAVAAVLGVADEDFRVLSVLTTWLGVHHAYVNVGRLERFLRTEVPPRALAYWASVGLWLAKDRRYARLVGYHKGAPIGLLATGNDFQIERRGEDPRFAGAPLRVPDGTLRDRPEDVLAPEALVHRHRGYRNRVLMGPSWRAQVWTLLEEEPDLTVSEVARRSGCAFATAWEVTRDFRLLEPPSAMLRRSGPTRTPGEF